MPQFWCVFYQINYSTKPKRCRKTRNSIILLPGKKANCTSVRFFSSVETKKAMGTTNGGYDRDFLFRIMVGGIYLILCMLGYSLLASVFCFVCIVSVIIHWLCMNNCECVSYVFYVAPTNFDFRFHHNFSFQYAGKHLTRPSFMRSLIKKKEHQKSTHKHGH